LKNDAKIEPMCRGGGIVRETLRLFLAINLDDSEKDLIRDYCEKISVNFRLARPTWVNGKLMHISLHFFGEVDNQTKMSIETGLAALQNKPTIESCDSTGLVYLPSARDPRVLCLKIEVSPEKAVSAFVKDIRKLAINLGTATDNRPWRGHITLARLKTMNAPLLSSLPDPPLLRFHPKSFDLMRSVLLPGGPVYHIVKRF
jgi:2'-5' RNA ligase